MDTIETRELFTSGKLTVRAIMSEDQHSRPDEYDSTDAPMLVAWQRGDWRYVGMSVEIIWDGRVIAGDALWSIEHGDLGDDVTADAWECTLPSQDGDTVDLGSPFGGVLDQALTDAYTFLFRAFYRHPRAIALHTPLGRAISATAKKFGR